MENGGFQSQVLSVMEVLAKAAVAEINRRVDDSCALLRLEVSQSRRDIALLKRKCEAMEAELRRTRMRAKRKGEERMETGPSPSSCPQSVRVKTCVFVVFLLQLRRLYVR